MDNRLYQSMPPNNVQMDRNFLIPSLFQSHVHLECRISVNKMNFKIKKAFFLILISIQLAKK